MVDAKRTSNVVRAVAVVVVAVSTARADDTIRLSNSIHGGPANYHTSDGAAISGDGGTVVFSSRASDLVAGDTNGFSDVFVYDRTTQTLTRVMAAAGEPNGDSFRPVVSSDGRLVAFESYATNFASDPNGSIFADVFLYDRTAGTVSLISMDSAGKGANGSSGSTSISADGSRIAFSSWATNLDPSDSTVFFGDVFVYDATAQTITLVSRDGSGVQGDDSSFGPAISGDGSKVAFESYATNFPHAGTRYSYQGVYLKDLFTGALERVDSDSTGSTYSQFSGLSGISKDGSQVLFTTSTALVAADFQTLSDVYLRDRSAGVTELVDLTEVGAVPVWGSASASMSDDGRFVAFSSKSWDVVGDDSNDTYDVFVRDRVRATTKRVSVGTYDEEGSLQMDIGGDPGGSAISNDGKIVAFETQSPEFSPNDSVGGFVDLFLRERSLTPATWTHYGTGYPGRHGTIPTMTPESSPWRGSSVTIDLTNSSGLYTVAFVFVGGPRDSIPTGLGGTLLLDDSVIVPVALSKTGGVFEGDVPSDWWADGLVVDLQTLELDPYANYGVSFTDGLEAVLGDG